MEPVLGDFLIPAADVRDSVNNTAAHSLPGPFSWLGIFWLFQQEAQADRERHNAQSTVAGRRGRRRRRNGASTRRAAKVLHTYVRISIHTAQPWGRTFHLHMLREDMLRGLLRSRCRPAILQAGDRLAANVEGSRRPNVGEGAAI